MQRKGRATRRAERKEARLAAPVPLTMTRDEGGIEGLAIYTVRVGDREIETTATDGHSNAVAAAWIAAALRVHRALDCNDDNPGFLPLVIGMATLRAPYNWYARYMKYPKDDLPVALIVLCVGGRRCFVTTTPHLSGWALPAPLRAFLAGKDKAVFAGVGIAREAAKLRRDWGLVVSRPTELRGLVEEAFREEANRGMFRRKGKVGIEELAAAALDGMKVEKRPDPRKLEWSGQRDEEQMMYAVREAYLSYVVATKCLGIIASAAGGTRKLVALGCC